MLHCKDSGAVPWLIAVVRASWQSAKQAPVVDAVRPLAHTQKERRKSVRCIRWFGCVFAFESDAPGRTHPGSCVVLPPRSNNCAGIDLSSASKERRSNVAKASRTGVIYWGPGGGQRIRLALCCNGFTAKILKMSYSFDGFAICIFLPVDVFTEEASDMRPLWRASVLLGTRPSAPLMRTLDTRGAESAINRWSNWGHATQAGIIPGWCVRRARHLSAAAAVRSYDERGGKGVENVTAGHLAAHGRSSRPRGHQRHCCHCRHQLLARAVGGHAVHLQADAWTTANGYCHPTAPSSVFFG